MKMFGPSKITWERITASQAVKARLDLIRAVRENIQTRGETQNCLVSSSPTVALADYVQRSIPYRAKEQLGVHLFSGGELTHFLDFTAASTSLSIDALPFINDTTTRELVEANEQQALPEDSRSDFPLAMSQLIEAYKYKYVENRLDTSYVSYFGETGIFALSEALSLGSENIEVYSAKGDSTLYLLTFDLNNGHFRIIFREEFLKLGTPPYRFAKPRCGSYILIRKY